MKWMLVLSLMLNGCRGLTHLLSKEDDGWVEAQPEVPDPNPSVYSYSGSLAQSNEVTVNLAGVKSIIVSVMHGNEIKILSGEEWVIHGITIVILEYDVDDTYIITMYR